MQNDDLLELGRMFAIAALVNAKVITPSEGKAWLTLKGLERSRCSTEEKDERAYDA